MKLKLLLQDKKVVKAIVVIGLIGILLIFLSSFFPKEEKTSQADVTDVSAPVMTNEEYEQRYQQIVQDLVKNISGAGEAKVVVTLDSGVEYVYETEENQTADTQNNASNSYSERNSLERNTLLVEEADGSRKPLLRKTLEPKVRGVVVVCQGGGDVRVVERITEAVTTALGVSTTKVCVTEMSPDAGPGTS